MNSPQELKALSLFSHRKALLSPKLGKKRHPKVRGQFLQPLDLLVDQDWKWCPKFRTLVVGIQGDIPDFLQDLQQIPPNIPIPCDSLTRASQGPQDLQELRASKEFAATPALPDPRGTEGLRVCPEFRDRR